MTEIFSTEMFTDPDDWRLIVPKDKGEPILFIDKIIEDKAVEFTRGRSFLGSCEEKT